MEQLTSLQALYEDYYKEVVTIRKKSPIFAGILGLGSDPKKHPCHEAFYQAAKAWVEAFAADSPNPEEANAVVSFLLEAPAQNRESESYWYMYAAIGFIDYLVPFLCKSDARALAERMNALFPRYDRMPVHQTLYKKLLKAAK